MNRPPPGQLALDLLSASPPSFANFVPGANAECLAALRALAAGADSQPLLYLWGPPGAGKSHLLQAVVAAAAAIDPERSAETSRPGRAAAYLAGECAASAIALPGPGGLLALDDCERLGDAAQQALFGLINRLRAGERGALVVAGSGPPRGLALREDLRTRLAWGLVLQLRPLADEEKAWALAALAAERGLTMSPDVIPWMLTHCSRDLRALTALLDRLDRYALERQRAITLPLVRELLGGPAPDA